MHSTTSSVYRHYTTAIWHLPLFSNCKRAWENFLSLKLYLVPFDSIITFYWFYRSLGSSIILHLLWRQIISNRFDWRRCFTVPKWGESCWFIASICQYISLPLISFLLLLLFPSKNLCFKFDAKRRNLIRIKSIHHLKPIDEDYNERAAVQCDQKKIAKSL